MRDIISNQITVNIYYRSFSNLLRNKHTKQFVVVGICKVGHLFIAKLRDDLVYLMTSWHMERKFAVVQWSEEEDAGKLSEVKADTIRRYDDSKMD